MLHESSSRTDRGRKGSSSRSSPSAWTAMSSSSFASSSTPSALPPPPPPPLHPFRITDLYRSLARDLGPKRHVELDAGRRRPRLKAENRPCRRSTSRKTAISSLSLSKTRSNASLFPGELETQVRESKARESNRPRPPRRETKTNLSIPPPTLSSSP